jgi:hypothetical protein
VEFEYENLQKARATGEIVLKTVPNLSGFGIVQNNKVRNRKKL